MRSIKLPEPPGSVTSMPEIFDRGISSVVRRAVIIGNGASGAENQCIGLVRALGLSPNHSIYRVNRPKGGRNVWLRWLPVPIHKKLDCLIRQIESNWRCFPLSYLLRTNQEAVRPTSPELKAPLLSSGAYGLRALTMDDKPVQEADPAKIAALAQENVDRDGPLLVVASGRDTIAVAAAVKRLAPQATFVVQIQHPRRGLDQFDMVVTPLHDYYALSPAARQEVPKLLLPWLTPQQPPDKHVVLTVGALHHADTSMLRTAAAIWHDELASLSKPLLIVNIGGPARHCRYGEDLAMELVSALHRVLITCGSARITFSRRTPSEISNLVRRELGSHPKVYIWDGRGKPVYVVGGERCRWKFVAFLKSLRQKGVIRSFSGAEDMRDSWSYPPLNDTFDAARRICAALAERGWSLH